MKTKTTPKVAKQPRTMRRDKEEHLLMINKFVTDYIHAHKRFPSQVEIGRNIGLSREAIRSLIKDIDLEDLADHHLTRIKADDLIAGLFAEGQKGNVSAAKLWLQLVFKWAERMDLNLSGKVKVNGTIDLSKITDEQLKKLAEIKRKISAGD